MKVLVVVAFLIASVLPAHAYIDGGSGSYVLQIAMAGVLALLFSLKLAWTRLRTFVSGLFSKRSGSDSRIDG